MKAIPIEKETKTAPSKVKLSGERDIAMDYLRSFLIALVVSHHAAMAYISLTLPAISEYLIPAQPITDPNRWPLIDAFVGLNDTFFTLINLQLVDL